jgi:hypothetical protein
MVVFAAPKQLLERSEVLYYRFLLKGTSNIAQIQPTSESAYFSDVFRAILSRRFHRIHTKILHEGSMSWNIGCHGLAD